MKPANFVLPLTQYVYSTIRVEMKLEEQGTENPRVGSSILSLTTILFLNISSL